MDLSLKDKIYAFLQANPGSHTKAALAHGESPADVDGALAALQSEGRAQCAPGAGGLVPKWTLASARAKVPHKSREELEDPILAFLRGTPGFHSPAAVAASVGGPGSPAKAVNGVLHALHREGRVVCVRAPGGAKPRWAAVGTALPAGEGGRGGENDPGLKENIRAYLAGNPGARGPAEIAKAVVGPDAPKSAVNAALYALEREGSLTCSRGPGGVKPQWSLSTLVPAVAPEAARLPEVLPIE